MRGLRILALWVFAVLVGNGCGADPAKDGRPTGPGSGSGGGGAGGTGGSSGFSGFGASGGASGAGGRPPVVGGAGGMTTVKSSLIWIANSAEGTVSKLDTRSMTELGRYMTTPSGKSLPSRTSVAADGDVAVANRNNAASLTGFGSDPAGGGGAGITKIYASAESCPDVNGNGVVDTSAGAMDVKPWGQDECVAWHTPLNHFSNRAVAWAPPPAPDASAALWTSAAVDCKAAACTVDVFRLNGDTGAIENMIPVTGLSGMSFLAEAPPNKLTGNLMLVALAPAVIDNYGAYGGAADAGGNFWIFIANTTQLVRIDAVTMKVDIHDTPMGNGYGITIDEKGRIFVCGAHGISRFDPGTVMWANNFMNQELGFGGCMTDGAGKIWVGAGADQGVAGLWGFDAESLALVSQVNMDAMGRQMTVKGVSVDVDHNIWGVGALGTNSTGLANIAWRFNPMTREVASYEGLNGAYSYSDMTGFGLTTAGVIPPPLE